MDKKRKIVLDTNALLQMLGRHSKYHFLYEKFLNEEYWLCVSNEIVHEYEEILEIHASPVVANLFMKVLELKQVKFPTIQVKSLDDFASDVE